MDPDVFLQEVQDPIREHYESLLDQTPSMKESIMDDFENFVNDVDAEDPLEQLGQFRDLIEVVIDLAEAIAAKTNTPLDDKTVAIIRNLIDRLMGPA